MIKLFAFTLIELIALLPSRFRIKFLNNLVKKFNERDKSFYYSINYRDKFFEKLKIKNKSNSSIIIQGPILKKNNFTINTINLYIKNCKSSIILSTWKNELTDKEILDLKKRGVKIIINDPPNFTGPKNINFQLKSTFEALRFSLKNRDKFTIKTRTDCRVYLKDFDKNLLRFYYFFKKKNNALRLGSTSLTRERRLFGISDILMFGPTKELLNYFPKSYSKEDFKTFEKFLKNLKTKDKKFLRDSYMCIPENFLCFNYLKKNINKSIKYDEKNYKRSLKNNFIIIDNSAIDFFWFKYNHQFEYRDKEFVNTNLYSYFSHLKWLKIFFKYDKIKY